MKLKQKITTGGDLRDKRPNWKKPTLGRVSEQCPAHAGYFYVQPEERYLFPAQGRENFCTEKDDSMQLVEQPICRSKEEPAAIIGKIKQEIEDEKARIRKFLAELFLQGPDAWPDIDKV